MQQIWDAAGVLAQYFVPFLIVLSIVVFVHEFGHFWVARRCGVRVLNFSIGMGKELFGFTDKKGTRWRFSLLPLGGYVQMFGDADPSSSTVDETAMAMPAEERKVAFFAQSVRKRLAIIAAGPAANYLFAILLWGATLAIVGQPVTRPVIEGFTGENTAAAEAGLLPGDKILSVDGREIAKFSDLQRVTMLNTGTPMRLEYERQGEIRQTDVTPKIMKLTDRFGNETKMARLGITASTHTDDYEELSVGAAFAESVTTVWRITTDTLTLLGQMITGSRSADDLGGALRIAKISGDIAKTRDVENFIWFIVILSVNLGLINLFPIPMLDGGHIFFYLVEAIRRRPLSERFQEYAARIGLGTVLFILGFTLWNDLVYLKVLPYLKTLFT